MSTYTFAPSYTPLSWRSLEGAFYAEDAIKLTPSLELRLGFRGEFTNGWNEAYGRASNYLFTNGVINTNPTVGNSAFSVNNAKFLPAPRVGIAWSPFGSKKTVIRAGAGLYYALIDNLSYRLDQNPPFNTVEAAKNVPIATVLAGGSNTSVFTGSSAPKVIPSGVQPDLQTPTVISYDFKIEQQITPNTTVSVGYIGSHGYHEILSIDANVPSNVVICPASPCPATYPSGAYFYYASLAAPLTGTPALANPNVANTTHWFSEGVSSYNGLEVDVNHRFSHGLQFRGVYTFSKALDDGDSMNTSVATNSPAFASNPLNPLQADYGRASFDIRHSAVINATYDLPFGRKSASGDNPWWNTVIGNWQISGIETLLSGLPFTPQLSYNPVKRRRLAQSSAAILESGFYRPDHPGRPRPIFRSQRVHCAAGQHLRQRAAQLLARSRESPKPICPWQRSSYSRKDSIFSSGPSFSIFSIAPTSTIRTRSYSLRRRLGHRPRLASLLQLPPVRGRSSLD